MDLKMAQNDYGRNSSRGKMCIQISKWLNYIFPMNWVILKFVTILISRDLKPTQIFQNGPVIFSFFLAILKFLTRFEIT